MASISQRIAGELNAQEWQVQAAIDLLDSGATVPFIARYRKEATGTLDDAQLRTLDERLRYLRELEERRKAILDSIESQGKLDDALRRQILSADTKARLEDLYLPYKPKRRTAWLRGPTIPTSLSAPNAIVWPIRTCQRCSGRTVPFWTRSGTVWPMRTVYAM